MGTQQDAVPRRSASGGRWLVASRGVRGPPAPPPSLPRFSPPRLPPCIVCSVSGKPNHGERMGRLLRGIRLHGSPRGGTGATARTGGRRHAARQLQCDRASQSLRGALKPGAPRCPRGTTGGAGTAVSMAVGSSPLPSRGAAAVGGKSRVWNRDLRGIGTCQHLRVCLSPHLTGESPWRRWLLLPSCLPGRAVRLLLGPPPAHSHREKGRWGVRVPA